MISDGFCSMETQKDGPHRKKNSIRTEVLRRALHTPLNIYIYNDLCLFQLFIEGEALPSDVNVSL